MQQFYECRVASLERYVGFCVMFHAMAESSRSPWLHLPWDIARSQSNLRVSTTGEEFEAVSCFHFHLCIYSHIKNQSRERKHPTISMKVVPLLCILCQFPTG